MSRRRALPRYQHVRLGLLTPDRRLILTPAVPPAPRRERYVVQAPPDPLDGAIERSIQRMYEAANGRWREVSK